MISRSGSEATPAKDAAGAQPPTLVGREREFSAIDPAISQLGRGAPSSLAMVGEPGIGKTALIREASRRAEAAGVTVVSGRGTEFERDVPFGAFVDALDALLADHRAELVDALTVERLNGLAAIFPSLSELGDGRPTRLRVERYRLHDAVRVALDRVAAERPILIALDDLHWADRATVELLAHLLRHALRGPVLMLVGYRQWQAPGLLRRAIGQAARAGAVTTLEVQSLTEAEADQLIGEEVEPQVRRELYLESGGNPFLITELARVVKKRTELSVDKFSLLARGPNEVPTAIRSAIEDELASRTATARALAETAAVVGEPFDPELAASVASIATDALPSALDELATAGLVHLAEIPGRFSFRHPIVRRAIYDALGVSSRSRAHERAAAALEHSGASLSARAHHVERSARVGDESAIEVLAAAAEATSDLAPATAARWLAATLRLLPDDAAPERRLGVLVPLATALGITGRVEESRGALVEALPLLRSEDHAELRAQLLGAIARLDHMVGRHREARTMLADAIAQSEVEGAPQNVSLKVDLALNRWLADDWGGAAEAAAAARETADPSRDPVSYATACALEALACGSLGEHDRALTLTETAERSVDSAPDSEIAARIESLLLVGHTEFLLERGGGRARHFERGLRIARTSQQDTWFGTLMCELAVSRIYDGRLTDAAVAADEALEVSRLGHPLPQIWALNVRAWVHRLAGDFDAALAFSEEAVDIAAQDSSSAFSWLAHAGLALTRIEAGDAVGARDVILANAGGPELSWVDASWRPYWFANLARAELSLDEPELAAGWVARAEATAAAYPLPGRIAEADLVRAELELARGKARAAADGAEAARAGFATASRPIDTARAELLAGLALAAMDERGRALQRLHHARGEFDRCGAARYRDQAASKLRQLGERPGRPAGVTARARVAKLSARELEVAELVAQGMTNREIAAQLYLSPKTIETHLRRSFDKLGVSSRTALALAIERATASVNRSG
jgi:DNA-binding CsgD family transcriptional regulator